jgi:hypothetical protein
VLKGEACDVIGAGLVVASPFPPTLRLLAGWRGDATTSRRRVHARTAPPNGRGHMGVRRGLEGLIVDAVTAEPGRLVGRAADPSRAPVLRRHRRPPRLRDPRLSRRRRPVLRRRALLFHLGRLSTVRPRDDRSGPHRVREPGELFVLLVSRRPARGRELRAGQDDSGTRRRLCPTLPPAVCCLP